MKAISPANRTNRIVIGKELNLDLPILKCSTNMDQSIRHEYLFFSSSLPRGKLDVIIAISMIGFFLYETIKLRNMRKVA